MDSYTHDVKERWKTDFLTNGYLQIDGLLRDEELNLYRGIVCDMLSGVIDASGHRHDIGNTVGRKRDEHENVCQIMWPCVYLKDITSGPVHQRSRALAKYLLGDDMEMDFDMIMAKEAGTDTATPWHQDASYWPKFPDSRALSVWVAMDDARVDNGCMWFVPGSHAKPMREHWRIDGKHVKTCHCDESEGLPVPVRAGCCTVHHGYTLHYTRGNSTDKARRAYICVYRPKDMVRYSRELGIDHGKMGLAVDYFEKDHNIDATH